MSNANCIRSGYKDVFNAFLTKNARFVGDLEIPAIKTSKQMPNKIIPFTEARKTKDFNSWVCFYEDDWRFECLWRNPNKYINLLKRFNGVISPDFSLYSDMPLVQQQWNKYRNHSLAHWFTENGIEVIPNVRWGDKRTYDLACLGVEENSTIAVGTHGCIKTKQYKQEFIEGLDYVVERLRPKTIIVYGSDPEKVFSLSRLYGIEVLKFTAPYYRISQKEVM